MDAGDSRERHPRPLSGLSPSAAPWRTAWSSAFVKPEPFWRIQDETEGPSIALMKVRGRVNSD